VQQIHYWCQNKRCEGKIIDGYKYIYASYKQWHDDNFPFWSIATIQRIISTCEDGNYIVSGQFSDDKLDKTKYYRVNYDHINLISSTVSNCDDVKRNSKTTETETITETTGNEDHISVGVEEENLFTGIAPPKPSQRRTKEEHLQGAELALQEFNKSHVNGEDEIPPQLEEYLRGLWVLVRKAACNPPNLSPWRKQLKELWEAGVREPHAQAAIREMQDKDLDIFSPSSIMKISLKHKMNKVQEQRGPVILEAGSPEWRRRAGRE
jgi:hypothetical protein